MIFIPTPTTSGPTPRNRTDCLTSTAATASPTRTNTSRFVVPDFCRPAIAIRLAARGRIGDPGRARPARPDLAAGRPGGLGWGVVAAGDDLTASSGRWRRRWGRGSRRRRRRHETRKLLHPVAGDPAQQGFVGGSPDPVLGPRRPPGPPVPRRSAERPAATRHHRRPRPRRSPSWRPPRAPPDSRAAGRRLRRRPARRQCAAPPPPRRGRATSIWETSRGRPSIDSNAMLTSRAAPTGPSAWPIEPQPAAIRHSARQANGLPTAASRPPRGSISAPPALRRLPSLCIRIPADRQRIGETCCLFFPDPPGPGTRRPLRNP